jgi:MtrB/PioB family decaheme-associated outer membrane protein
MTAIAVQGALLALYALPVQAEDDLVTSLTRPDNYVEIGVTGVDQDSAKFGEYSGLKKSEATAIGNFSIRGGDYGAPDGVTRWSVSGRNLGLTNREFGASYSRQGQWNIGIGYDELQHNTTDGYQTPYIGSMGGNEFTLPSGFTKIGNTTLTTDGNLTAANYEKFRTVEVNNTRKNTSLTAGYSFGPNWRLSFDYNNLEQSGAKLMGFSSDGNLSGVSGERPAILPNPTNYTTDTFHAVLDWKGDQGHLSGAYYASIFRDHYDRVNWTTFAGALATDTMSTAPGNEFHQFSLTGGYRLSPRTRISGGLSYGRNTQDAGYVASAADLVAIPRSSLDGRVVTTHADLKVVDQTTRDLKLSAGVVYNKRDNQTTSMVYEFKDLGGGTYEIPNTPYSYDKAQYELAGDYRLGKGNSLRLAYNYDHMKRWCNTYGVSADYPAGTACLVDTATKEQKFSVGYKLKMGDSLDFNAKYVYADRTTDYNTLARVALDSLRGGTNFADGTNLGIPGLNGGDYPGFHPYFDASRKQSQLKAGVTWQPTDALSLGINGRYADDDYKDAPFGIQKGRSWNATFDASFNYSDNGSVFAYVTQDYRDRYIMHVTDSTRTSNGVTTRTAYAWGDQLKDEGTTFGLGFKQGGLLGGKVDVKLDAAYSDASSNYSSKYLAFVSGATTATSCAAANSMLCGSAPDIVNRLTQVRLTGSYRLDKQSKIIAGYLYQKLESTDYFYNSYQYLYTPTGVLPTNQQNGSYEVNLLALSYHYTFK